MTLANSRLVSLNYGRQSSFSCEVDVERIAAAHIPPEPNPEFARELAQALAHPLEFPPLAQAFIPDDHVTLALDRHTPESAAIIAAVWKILAGRGVTPENVIIAQPMSMIDGPLADPRVSLPDDVRERVVWKVHEPGGRNNCAYLASTTTGERVYLAREIIDADVVVSIGQTSYDPVLGYRGTNSVFYPGMSSADAIGRANGQWHTELGPDDDRPLRQVIDEVGWLLGTQVTIQVIPAARGGVFRVVAGATETVLRRCRELLAESWLVELESRPEIVVAAVEADAAGHGWSQIGAALATARNLVAKDGKIVILSELDVEPGPGLKIVRQCENPREAIKPLRIETPPDLIAATQLATTVDWAKVYFLSRLESDLVEDLFMVPLANDGEVARLLAGDDRCVFLGSAQHVYGRIVG